MRNREAHRLRPRVVVGMALATVLLLLPAVPAAEAVASDARTPGIAEARTAETAELFATQGACGPVVGGRFSNNIQWALNSGVLTISGRGEMEDFYNHSYLTPWDSVADSIRRVEIQSGVTSIGSGAFLSCADLTSISIPGTVDYVGAMAFAGCTSLRTVTLGYGLTTIGDGMFQECTALRSISIPATVQRIGPWAFFQCTGLTSVSLSSGLTVIDEYAFSECTSLGSINVPGSVVSVGLRAFDGCSALRSAVLQPGVRVVAEGAFYACASLTAVSLPDGLQEIGPSAFYGTGLTSVTIPDSVTRIGTTAFAVCKSLRTVSLPEGLSTLEEQTFRECVGLTEVSIPAAVTLIQSGAFAGCTSLTDVMLTASVTSIGDLAFGTYSITDIYFVGSLSQWLALEKGNNLDFFVLARVHTLVDGSGRPEVSAEVVRTEGGSGARLYVTNRDLETLSGQCCLTFFHANGQMYASHLLESQQYPVGTTFWVEVFALPDGFQTGSDTVKVLLLDPEDLTPLAMSVAEVS